MGIWVFRIYCLFSILYIFRFDSIKKHINFEDPQYPHLIKIEDIHDGRK